MFLSGVKANDNRTIQGFVKDYVDEYVGEYSLDAFICVTVLRASVYKKKKSLSQITLRPGFYWQRTHTPRKHKRKHTRKHNSSCFTIKTVTTQGQEKGKIMILLLELELVISASVEAVLTVN